MSIGRGSASNPGMPPAVRGAALIGLLVLVGIIGLQVLDDSSPGGGQVTVTTLPGQTTLSSPTATTVKPATATTVKPATATTKKPATATTVKTATGTTAKVKKNADVKVVVYNASGVQGKAQNMSDKLKSVGYNSTVGGNLTPVRTGTTVQCKAGLEAEATKLAADGVGNGATVAPYPTNPPKGSEEADCIVTLGKAA